VKRQDHYEKPLPTSLGVPHRDVQMSK
jgi:hypothetical protein